MLGAEEGGGVCLGSGWSFSHGRKTTVRQEGEEEGRVEKERRRRRQKKGGLRGGSRNLFELIVGENYCC